MGAMSVADSVRLAMPVEAVDIARIQRAAWAGIPALAAAAAALSADEATHMWHQAITRPPLAHQRVLVALAAHGVAGFAVTGPSPDADAEPADGCLAEFVIDPRQRGAGHGSRLLQAAVDTLLVDGYETARMWIPSTNDSLRAFLVSAGFAPDGAHQEVGLDAEGPRLKLVRLHASISG